MARESRKEPRAPRAFAVVAERTGDDAQAPGRVRLMTRNKGGGLQVAVKVRDRGQVREALTVICKPGRKAPAADPAGLHQLGEPDGCLWLEVWYKPEAGEPQRVHVSTYLAGWRS